MLPYHSDESISEWIAEYPEMEPVSFKNTGLQAVVKLADYTFTPGAEFEGVWHYEGKNVDIIHIIIDIIFNSLSFEGMAHEDIVMTGLFYPRSDEGLGGGLEFKRTFTNVEGQHILFSVPQERPGWVDEMIKDVGFVPLGNTTTETGKLMVFPNCHAHRVTKMKNPTTKTVTRRLVAFFVINPDSRIPSSRDHPPMPRQIDLKTALANRLELMQERKFAKEKLNPREIELCEH